MKLRIAFAVGAIPLAFNSSLAAEAPAALLNKTIRVSYGLFIPGRSSDGSINPSGRKVALVIYVSSAGRIFFKAVNRAGQFGRDAQAGPERTGGSFRFAGSTLVGTAVGNGNIAAQLTISFDANFQGCNAKILVGGESGAPISWVGLNGIRYTATGHPQISAVSCSVESGNAFAS